MAGLSASEKQMLKVLGVILIIMGAVWGRKFLKKSGSSSVKGRSRSVATASRRTSSSRGKAKTSARKKKQVLTPRDIPRLNDNLKLKLKQMKNPDKKKTNVIDEIMYGTRNIFLPPEVTDKDVELERRQRKQEESGGEVMSDAIYFRGVANVNGERLAIIERPNRTIPWYAKEGEKLDGTDFTLQNIATNDQHITLVDAGAKRERDRIRTVPWTGLEKAELEGQTLSTEAKPVPEAAVEAVDDDFGFGEEDMEIME
jgi:hypothetical protein